VEGKKPSVLLADLLALAEEENLALELDFGRGPMRLHNPPKAPAPPPTKAEPPRPN